MSNMMTDGLDWLATQLGSVSVAGNVATLSRGLVTATLNVVSQGDGGDGEYATQMGDTPEDTVYVVHPPERGYCGFLAKTSDYAIDGVAVLPERGDTLTIGGRVFAVSSPVGTMPWKYHPNPMHRTWIWIHTKLSDYQNG